MSGASARSPSTTGGTELRRPHALLSDEAQLDRATHHRTTVPGQLLRRHARAHHQHGDPIHQAEPAHLRGGTGSGELAQPLVVRGGAIIDEVRRRRPVAGQGGIAVAFERHRDARRIAVHRGRRRWRCRLARRRGRNGLGLGLRRLAADQAREERPREDDGNTRGNAGHAHGSSPPRPGGDRARRTDRRAAPRCPGPASRSSREWGDPRRCPAARA